jgi:hypothetical protein
MLPHHAECVQIFRDAIERYESLTPFKPYASIAEAMIIEGHSITEASVRSKVSGERPFLLAEAGLFFQVTNYPEGFQRLMSVFCGIPWITKRRDQV